jgi:hypothetical protein
MNILASWAASKAVLTPGLAISISSAVRADSLDSFAIWALLSAACFLVITSSRGPWRSLSIRRERAAVAGTHRSPSRWARACPPRAGAGRAAPRHAATGGGAALGHLSVRTGRMIWRRRVAFLLPSAFSRSRASSQSPYSA